MREAEERAAVVTSGRRWNGTRFRHHSAVLRSEGDRGGIDCAHLLLEAHVGAGLIERFAPDHYPHDWHMHRDEERFLSVLEQYARRVGDTEDPIRDRGTGFAVLPGNVLIWRFGRTFSHGAIVSSWPSIIHASFPAQCCLEETVMGGRLERLPMRIYSRWGR